MFPCSLLPALSSTFRPHTSTMTSILLVTLSRTNSPYPPFMHFQALRLGDPFCCLRPASRRARFANSPVAVFVSENPARRVRRPPEKSFEEGTDKRRAEKILSLFSSLKSFGCLGTAQRCELLTSWIFGNWHWDISLGEGPVLFASFESRVLWRGKEADCTCELRAELQKLNRLVNHR